MIVFISTNNYCSVAAAIGGGGGGGEAPHGSHWLNVFVGLLFVAPPPQYFRPSCSNDNGIKP